MSLESVHGCSRIMPNVPLHGALSILVAHDNPNGCEIHHDCLGDACSALLCADARAHSAKPDMISVAWSLIQSFCNTGEALHDAHCLSSYRLSSERYRLRCRHEPCRTCAPIASRRGRVPECGEGAQLPIQGKRRSRDLRSATDLQTWCLVHGKVDG
jgi:hypothetical protein